MFAKVVLPIYGQSPRMNTGHVLVLDQPAPRRRRLAALLVAGIALAIAAFQFLLFAGASASRTDGDAAPGSMVVGQLGHPANALGSTALSPDDAAPSGVPLVEPRVRTSSISISRDDGVLATAGVRSAGGAVSTTVGVEAIVTTAPTASPVRPSGTAAAPNGLPLVRWELQGSGALRVSTIPPVDPSQASFGIRLTTVTDGLEHAEALYLLCSSDSAAAWDLLPDGPITSVQVLQSGSSDSLHSCAQGVKTMGSE